MTEDYTCVASCHSNKHLREKAFLWSRVHGPKTRVLVNPKNKTVWIAWGKYTPHKDSGMVEVEQWLEGKNGKSH